jgi:hypothetical protein
MPLCRFQYSTVDLHRRPTLAQDQYSTSGSEGCSISWSRSVAGLLDSSPVTHAIPSEGTTVALGAAEYDLGVNAVRERAAWRVSTRTASIGKAAVPRRAATAWHIGARYWEVSRVSVECPIRLSSERALWHHHIP